MIIFFNIILLFLLGLAGSYLTKIENNSINKLLLNIEFSLFFCVLILYVFGTFIHNPIGIYIVCIFILLFSILGIRSQYLSPNINFFKHKTFILFGLASLVGPVIVIFFSNFELTYQGDGFYSWSTWATHWSSRESLSDYKFVYSQNLPIIMSFFNRIYGSSEIMSAGSTAFKLCVIQYLFIFVCRFFISFKTLIIRYVFVDLLLYFSLVVILLKTYLFQTAQSGLPDIFIGLIFLSIVINRNKVLKRPLLFGVMLFGLANLKLTSLPFVLVLSIYFLCKTFKTSYKKTALNLFIIAISFSPFLYDYKLPKGDMIQNHTHNASIKWYQDDASDNSKRRKQIIDDAFLDYDKLLVAEKNLNFFQKHLISLEIFESSLEKFGQKGSIYLTPYIFKISDKMLVFYSTFHNDLSIYLILFFLIYLTFFYPLIGIPILISLLIWWKNTSYGFYNLNGSFILLILSIYYYFYIKRKFYSYENKVNLKSIFVFAAIPFLIGQKLTKDDEFVSKMHSLNKLSWNEDFFLKNFDAAVFDDTKDAEELILLGRKFSEFGISLPPPFNRLDGRFTKSVYTADSYKNLNDLEIYHSYSHGSLMIDNFSINFTEDFFRELPEAKFENITFSCLSKNYGLVSENESATINRVIDVGSECSSPSNVDGLNILCPKVNYYSSHNYSPINGLYLKTDMKPTSSLWWKFAEADDYEIRFKFSEDFRDAYSFVLSAVNEFKVYDNKRNLIYHDKEWPSSRVIELKEPELNIVFRDFGGLEPRFIASFIPVDKSLYINKCGEYSNGNLCVIKGDEVTKICSRLEK